LTRVASSSRSICSALIEARWSGASSGIVSRPKKIWSWVISRKASEVSAVYFSVWRAETM
jgi:hypothetical protein